MKNIKESGESGCAKRERERKLWNEMKRKVNRGERYYEIRSQRQRGARKESIPLRISKKDDSSRRHAVTFSYE